MSKDKRFEDVVFMVEANSFETLMLWDKNSECEKHLKVNWVEDTISYNKIIGHMRSYDKLTIYPVVVLCFFAELNGKRVVFYESTSWVVDHEMIKAWMKCQCPEGTPECDAMNFSQCLNAVRKLKK